MMVFVWFVVSVHTWVVLIDRIVFDVLTLARSMFTPELAKTPAATTEGIRNIARIIAKDLVVGTSFITDMINTSIPE